MWGRRHPVIKSELGEIISKCFALYVLTVFVRNASYIYMPFFVHGIGDQEPGIYEHMYSLYALTILSHVILFCVFWFGAGGVGRLVTKKGNDKTILTLSADDAMVLVFTATGCILLIKAIPEVSRLIAHYISPLNARPPQQETVIATGLYFVLALTFIFGAKGLRNIVLYCRGMKDTK